MALVRDLQPEFCYKLINTKLVHRALDLSGGDHRTGTLHLRVSWRTKHPSIYSVVIGWEAHGSDNQKVGNLSLTLLWPLMPTPIMLDR